MITEEQLAEWGAMSLSLISDYQGTRIVPSLIAEVRRLRARMAEEINCGQHGPVCRVSPGCQWHWAQSVIHVTRERDALREVVEAARMLAACECEITLGTCNACMSCGTLRAALAKLNEVKP